jgi:NCS1 family nucleobase:cation symporter-1
MANAPRALFQPYYTAFFTGMAISFTSFCVVNVLFPIVGSGDFDSYDDWATFTPEEAIKLGIIPSENAEEFALNRFGRSGYKHDASLAQKEMDMNVADAYVSSSDKIEGTTRSAAHHF